MDAMDDDAIGSSQDALEAQLKACLEASSRSASAHIHNKVRASGGVWPATADLHRMGADALASYLKLDELHVSTLWHALEAIHGAPPAAAVAASAAGATGCVGSWRHGVAYSMRPWALLSTFGQRTLPCVQGRAACARALRGAGVGAGKALRGAGAGGHGGAEISSCSVRPPHARAGPMR